MTIMIIYYIFAFVRPVAISNPVNDFEPTQSTSVSKSKAPVSAFRSATGAIT